MSLLSQNLKSTEKFLMHLQHLNVDRPALSVIKTLAGDITSWLNETVHDREEQVCKLVKYEHKFQHIATEVGGEDALASLKVLEDPCALMLSDTPSSSTLVLSSPVPPESATCDLDTVAEESCQTWWGGKGRTNAIVWQMETRQGLKRGSCESRWDHVDLKRRWQNESGRKNSQKLMGWQ